ncbi:MAG: hypothetical protein H7274_20215 [Rhodoferax sp.]|nr:hypothetical protein [Rhodoferax sp.]
MIRNGIEYGMMQAYAEGFALLAGHETLGIDVAKVAELWRHGSVVRSWLLHLTATALLDPEGMDSIAPVVADSGEGRWTIDESIRQGTPAPVIAASLMARFSSQGKADTSNKLLSPMAKCSKCVKSRSRILCHGHHARCQIVVVFCQFPAQDLT